MPDFLCQWSGGLWFLMGPDQEHLTVAFGMDSWYPTKRKYGFAICKGIQDLYGQELIKAMSHVYKNDPWVSSSTSQGSLISLGDKCQWLGLWVWECVVSVGKWQFSWSWLAFCYSFSVEEQESLNRFILWFNRLNNNNNSNKYTNKNQVEQKQRIEYMFPNC